MAASEMYSHPALIQKHAMALAPSRVIPLRLVRHSLHMNRLIQSSAFRYVIVSGNPVCHPVKVR